MNNLETLIDEMKQAEFCAKDEYSTGYFDGLAMAVSILEGLTD